jgi:hypothetical protein
VPTKCPDELRERAVKMLLDRERDGKGRGEIVWPVSWVFTGNGLPRSGAFLTHAERGCC